MIYRLRARFIRICTMSFFAVFIVLFFSIFLFSCLRTNRQIDNLVDIIIQNDGHFPRLSESDMADLEKETDFHGMLTMESPFSTRFFTIWTDSDNNIVHTDISSVSSISENEAKSIAQNALESSKVHGWTGSYRYGKTQLDSGYMVVFVEGSIQRALSRNFLFTCIGVFAGGAFIVLLLIILFSKYAVKPIAESYEKQKRFITDASHELKTPLTLILTNVEIAQEETGPNEWLQDITIEGEHMSQLIKKMIFLARMDENGTIFEKEEFNLSDDLNEMLSLYHYAALQKKMNLCSDIEPSVVYHGNEESIRQLFTVLMDNALKYCDPGGDIRITLTQQNLFGKKHHILLTVDNTCSSVNTLRLDLLFDRFYRSDSARTAGEGFGIGLSAAKAIAEKHHGAIWAENLHDSEIRFRVRL